MRQRGLRHDSAEIREEVEGALHAGAHPRLDTLAERLLHDADAQAAHATVDPCV